MSKSSADNTYRKVVRTQARRGVLSPLRREKQMEYLESRLAEDFSGAEALDVLDACCARGRLLHFLNRFDSRHRYVGIDYSQEFVAEGREWFAEVPNVSLEHGDLFALSSTHPKRFDIAILYKTLLNFERYEPAIDALVAATRRKLYVTSLFYDGDVDFEIKVRQYAVYDDLSDFAYYNVWGTPRFAAHCRSVGAREVRFFDLSLDFDLPAPTDKDVLSVYISRLESGERLEIMGAVVMDWKLVEIEL